jgi:hypothetical protein
MSTKPVLTAVPRPPTDFTDRTYWAGTIKMALVSLAHPRRHRLALAVRWQVAARLHLALPQAEGFAASVLRLPGQEQRVPDHMTVSRRSRGYAARRPEVARPQPACPAGDAAIAAEVLNRIIRFTRLVSVRVA